MKLLKPKASSLQPKQLPMKSIAIITAHPDDETLWAGGTILNNPTWQCFVVSLCRKSDNDRAPKFYNALKMLNAEGIMGDLDDSPEQNPINDNVIENTILNLLPPKHYNLVITHNPLGEYTRHIRHEETGSAVIRLCNLGKISTNELWTFAYTDNSKQYHPMPIRNANIFNKLTKRIWLKKLSIITDIYGFKADSWEAQTTPKEEAFWKI